MIFPSAPAPQDGARRRWFSVVRGTLSDAHLRILEQAFPAFYWRPLSDVYGMLSELCGSPEITQEEESFVTPRTPSALRSSPPAFPLGPLPRVRPPPPPGLPRSVRPTAGVRPPISWRSTGGPLGLTASGPAWLATRTCSAG